MPATVIFADPANAVGDLVRLVVIVAGIVMLGLVIKITRDTRRELIGSGAWTGEQKRRYADHFGMYALVCFGVSAIGTEIEQLGGVVTYRLLFNTAGVVFGLLFLVKVSKATVDHGPDGH